MMSRRKHSHTQPRDAGGGRWLMRRAVAAAAASVALAAGAAAVSAPAHAGEDIDWFWNSEDTDIRASFAAHNEIIRGRDYAGAGKINWTAPGQGSNVWYVPGSSGLVQQKNASIPEGLDFNMQACQVHNTWPDDCSEWKDGTT